MDGARFDRWTRALAAGRTRRSAIRAVAGLAGAAALAARTAAPDDALAGGCAGYGCPCRKDANCADGLVCCGNSCQTTGDCGAQCRADGSACGRRCQAGAPCADCCGGFCAAYGGCTTLYYSYAGGACSLADPYACAPGLTCCPIYGGDPSDGVCQDVC